MNMPAATAPKNAMPTYADQLIGVLLTAGLQSLQASGVLSHDQVTTIVTDVVSLIGIAYALFAANPSKQSPIVFLMGLVGKAPKVDQAQWNSAIEAAKVALVPSIIALVDQQVKARAGILTGPIDAVANKAVETAADTAALAVSVPHMSL